jgi:hypothetical protein
MSRRKKILLRGIGDLVRQAVVDVCVFRPDGRGEARVRAGVNGLTTVSRCRFGELMGSPIVKPVKAVILLMVVEPMAVSLVMTATAGAGTPDPVAPQTM